MDFRLVKRRSVPVPTLFGTVVFVGAAAALFAAWWFKGESFLSITDRQPPEVLVVEGWIGPFGVRSAFDEFRNHGYKYVVATGGMSDQIWNDKRWSYALEGEKQLLYLGVPRSQLIVAVPVETESQRTYQSAIAVAKALRDANLHPESVNVFTMGVHARRSRLVFAKVLGPAYKVGAISWLPSLYLHENWRSSSEHAVDFLKESVGYVFELLFGSGRGLGIGDSAPRASGPNK
jgi:uncharacterized SAM-binding protein YcdF (DUF218 family)